MSNLNVRLRVLITHVNLMQTAVVGRFNMWVTPKTNRYRFCLILKLSHALDGLFNVLSRLHGRKHKCVFCWMKHHWTWQLSDYCLGFFLIWNPLFASWYRCCDGHFSGFGKYIFPQLQTSTALALSADCTEGSCSSNYIIVIFNNFLVLNFPFFDFEQ